LKVEVATRIELSDARTFTVAGSAHEVSSRLADAEPQRYMRIEPLNSVATDSTVS
jgi:hypothetical protein